MDEQTRQQYEAQSVVLRADLKRWEADWANAHGGKKPARDDIKQNAEIAQRYKDYHRIRDILSGKAQPQPPPKGSGLESTPRHKRKASTSVSGAGFQTPAKRPKTGRTPLKPLPISPGQQPLTSAVATPSLSRKLFSPAAPTSIGPTPQRDGRVLGLFDLLAAGDAPTPCKPLTAATAPTIHATPRKQRGGDDAVAAVALTPSSSTKRAATRPNTMATPLRSGHQSPRAPGSSVSERQRQQQQLLLATPAFLQRAPPPMTATCVSPAAPRLPRKALFRGLSSVVAGLRRFEEEALDEDLEALREVENEQQQIKEGRGPKSAVRVLPEKEAAFGDLSGGGLGQENRVPDGDSRDGASARAGGGVEGESGQLEDGEQQAPRKPRLLGGFDDEDAYDSPTEEQLGRDGRPLPVFQKKKPKRSTRLVNMRPTRTRRPDSNPNADEPEASEDIVAETQLDDATLLPGEEEPEGAAESDEYGGEMSDDEVEVEEGKRKGRVGKKKEKKKSLAAGAEKPDGQQGGPVQRAVRMVKATAHANFRRLKLKKKQPGSFGGRFRRRR